MKVKPTGMSDPIDLAIIVALQRNARIANVRLAELVGISPAPCLRRVQELERKGIIAGYQAVLDRSRVGLGVMALTEIQLRSTGAKAMDDFERAVTVLPEVDRCHVTSGGWDYMLEIYCSDLAAFEPLSRHLTQLPGVKRVRSRFALRDAVLKK